MFLDNTLNFINASDLKILEPNVRNITQYIDGTHLVTTNSFCLSNNTNLNDNYIIAQIIAFTLLDSLVDINHPELEDSTFRQRYLGLPTNNSVEFIFKETYRIFKLIRNAIIHNKNKIIKSDGTIKIHYTTSANKSKKTTTYTLECTHNAIQLIISIVVMFAKHKNNINSYTRLYLESYYNEMLKNIYNFSDDCGSSPVPILQDFPFKWILRYRITNPKFEIKDHGVYISKFLLDENESYAATEYVLIIEDKEYLIPEEALNSDSMVSQLELKKWLVNT